MNRQVACFFAECRSSPSVALGEEGLSRVLLFTECQDLCGTREILSSPSAILPRVPDFWHSAKPETLGEFCLSRSAIHQNSESSPQIHRFGESEFGETRAFGKYFGRSNLLNPNLYQTGPICNLWANAQGGNGNEACEWLCYRRD